MIIASDDGSCEQLDVRHNGMIFDESRPLLGQFHKQNRNSNSRNVYVNYDNMGYLVATLEYNSDFLSWEVKIFFIYYSISARIFDITELSDAFKSVLLMNI